MARPKTRKAGPAKTRLHTVRYQPDRIYTNSLPASTPGPILSRHWFRGCELLSVRSDDLSGKAGWAV
jgi:hypothetical protein